MKDIKVTILNNYVMLSVKDFVKILKSADAKIIDGKLPGMKTNEKTNRQAK